MTESHAIVFGTPDGVELAGNLFTPDELDAVRAGIVLTGPFTGVKEQVVATYAAGLAQRGFTCLAFDHRNFGASGGQPRQHEDPGGKITDLTAAVTHLLGRGDIDRVGCLGICLGGGYAIRFAAFDPRVSALVTVAGAYNDPRAMRDGIGPDGYRRTLNDLAEADPAGTQLIAAVAPAGEAAMPGPEPYEYYGTERGSTPRWRNQVTRASIRQLLTFDAMIGADFVSPTPTRIIHGTHDDYCPPSGAQAAYARLGEPRDLVWIDTTNHIDLYDRAQYVQQALDSAADWFSRHLASDTG